MRNTTTRVSRSIATATALGLFACASLAAASETKAVPQGATEATTAGSSGLRVYKDNNGKTRAPTQEEKVEAAAQDALADKGKAKTIKMVRQPNGMLRATDRDGLLAESVIAHKNADGTLSYEFVQGADPGVVPAPAAALEVK
jgi:hypothetical protein